jgi:hypothetical protein
MDKLLTWIRAFGNAGAVANASVLREQHRREEWILRGLTLRLEGTAEEAASAVA